MVIEIKSIRDKVPDPFNFNHTAHLAKGFNLAGDGTVPFEVSGKVVKEGDLYICEITAKTLLMATCELCLGEAPTPVAFSLKETYAKGGSQTDDVDIYPINDGVIDLTEALMAGLYLHLPTQFICGEDCQGLCKDCGINLNQGTCNCHNNEKEVDPRFAALKNMKF